MNLVVIQFEAIGETQTTPLTFHYGAPRNTDVTYGVGSVLTGDLDGQMQIGFFNKTSPTERCTGGPDHPNPDLDDQPRSHQLRVLLRYDR